MFLLQDALVQNDGCKLSSHARMSPIPPIPTKYRNIYQRIPLVGLRKLCTIWTSPEPYRTGATGRLKWPLRPAQVLPARSKRPPPPTPIPQYLHPPPYTPKGPGPMGPWARTPLGYGGVGGDIGV